jgi:hypothetical protein
MLMHRATIRRGARSAGIAAAIAFGLAGVLLQLPAGASEKPGQPSSIPVQPAVPAPPNGLVVVLKTEDLSDKNWREAVNNPSISGVALQIHWADIEKVRGKPDWSQLDDLFSAAQKSGKWVQLLVFPGFFSPDWALEAGPDGTPKTDIFHLQYGPGSDGPPKPLPMPWDTVYLNRWYAFLKELSDKYGTSPAFRVMACAGPTSVSAEFTLPNKPMDLKQWQADGYTPDKWEDAWHKTFGVCKSDFPHQFVSLSFGAGLAINNKGMIDHSEHLRTKQVVINDGMMELGNRFALQYSNLDGTTSPDVEGTQYLIGYARSIVTGLQLRTSAANKGMGADGDPPKALTLALNKGLAPNCAGQHVNYLEIYERDVVATDMQTALANGASLIAQPGHAGLCSTIPPSRVHPHQ